MSATARGVLLFTSRHVTWAHRAVILLTACPHADASRGRLAEGTLITRKLEPSIGLCGLVARADAQVLDRVINSYRVNQFARVHPIQRIPQTLEFNKCLHQFGAEHFRKKCGTSLTVTVFTGQRPSILQDDVRSFFDEAAILRDTVVGFEVERNA